MLALYTEAQKKRIANNIIVACQDITKLSKQSYNYLNLCSGFIAHYNHNGFKYYYSKHSLQNDIESNARMNQWKNFSPSDRDYEYYMSKRDIYNMILGRIVAREFVKDHFSFVIIGGNA